MKSIAEARRRRCLSGPGAGGGIRTSRRRTWTAPTRASPQPADPSRASERSDAGVAVPYAKQAGGEALAVSVRLEATAATRGILIPTIVDASRESPTVANHFVDHAPGVQASLRTVFRELRYLLCSRFFAERRRSRSRSPGEHSTASSRRTRPLIAMKRQNDADLAHPFDDRTTLHPPPFPPVDVAPSPAIRVRSHRPAVEKIPANEEKSDNRFLVNVLLLPLAHVLPTLATATTTLRPLATALRLRTSSRILVDFLVLPLPARHANRARFDTTTIDSIALSPSDHPKSVEPLTPIPLFPPDLVPAIPSPLPSPPRHPPGGEYHHV